MQAAQTIPKTMSAVLLTLGGCRALLKYSTARAWEDLESRTNNLGASATKGSFTETSLRQLHFGFYQGSDNIVRTLILI